MNRRTGVAVVAGALVAAAAARLLVIRSIDGAFEVGWPEPPLGSFRLWATGSALAAGAGLGASGAVLQSILRNPLASPFVLGVSSGAGAGVAIASVLAAAAGAAAPSGAGAVVPAALGALAALAAVLALSIRYGRVDPVTMVLGGIVVGTVAAAASVLAESMLGPERRGMLAAWLFGRIPDTPEPGLVATCAASALGLTTLASLWGPRLDAAALGDDEARTLGVPLGTTRAVLLVASGVATACTVMLCGPIAFIGLLAPHLARATVGARHRGMVVGSAVAGAALLVGADAVRQWVDVSGGRLPLGAVTAAVGGGAFLILLRRMSWGWSR